MKVVIMAWESSVCMERESEDVTIPQWTVRVNVLVDVGECNYWRRWGDGGSNREQFRTTDGNRLYCIEGIIVKR